MKRFAMLSLVATLAVAATAAIAAAVDPAAATLILSFFNDPHAQQAGVLLAGGTVAVDTDFLKDELGKLSDKLKGWRGEYDARLLELEQRAVRRGDGSDGPLDSPGLANQLAATEGFQALRRGLTREFRFEIPRNTFRAAITNTGNTVGTTTVAPDLLRAPGMRRATVRDLLPSVPTGSNAVQYARETAFDNQADLQTEGSTKAESALTFELETAPIVTIAHFIRASRQVLDDLPLLQNYIDTRLRYGLMLREEAQLLLGSGSGINLEGIYTAADAYSAPAGISVTAETRIDRIREAIAQLAVANYIATGIVLHPTDWATIELAKEATTNAYLWSKPQVAASPMLWGVPVIATTAIPVDTALVADFQAAAVLLDREAARVDISTEDGDNFVQNMCTIRCEERIGLAVRLPAAAIKIADISP
jgi:HK97 family phage major capsid protein